MLTPIYIAGGDYQHKDRTLSNQVTRNFWPQVQGTQKAKSPYTLQSFYGLKTFKLQAGGADRGMYVNQSTFYKISGTTLYSVASDGTHTSLGTIPGTERCIIKGLGSSIVINNGSGAIYTWDGAVITQNTSPNLGTPNGVAVLNSQAIYDAGSGQGFDVSDVGDPGTINGVNNASAESESDALIIPYAYKETLYLFGDKTIELWWNSGQGNPPFDKIQGAIINVGLAAKHSVCDNPDYVFFLGTDRQVHTLTGGASAVDTVISTPEMAKEFQDYSTISDAIGWTMQLQGQWFHVLTFPFEDKTWVYPVGGEWFQWGTGTEGRIRANGYVFAHGKHLVSDYQSAYIYELDAQTYTDAGDEIIRVRESAPIHGGLFQNDGKEFELQSLEVELETGVGLTSGQGEDPLIMVSFSKDGGKTFGTERMLRCGRLGEHVTVKTSGLGRYKQCNVRLRASDPISWSIHKIIAYVEPCI